MIEVIELTTKDIVWPFEGAPYVLIGGGNYRRRTTIDPFPCYTHNAKLVRQLTWDLQNRWPLPFPLKYFLLPAECPSRTNGWYQIDAETYEKGKGADWRMSITFSGKRIPIHPAMTRYLVTHEYGHAVEDHLIWLSGEQPGHRGILEEYRKIRDLPKVEYGGGTWHNDLGEVFANDFRIVYMGVEKEFWPHSVSRPEEVPAVLDFWQNYERMVA